MSLLAKRKATDYLVVHCTATPEGRDYTVNDIDRMHRARGFTMIGYHYLIDLNGKVLNGRPEDTVGAHVEGFNSVSVGISYVGGVDAKGKAKDTRTVAQKIALTTLLGTLKGRYPNAKIVGHRDFSKDQNGNGRIDPFERMKECPCFDAIPEYAGITGAPAPAVCRGADSYTVVAGDTLYAIARRFGTTVDGIAKASGINPNAPLKVGQILHVG